jgi:hypothetical protein
MQCLSPLKFEPRSWRGVLDTTLCDKVCQWLATGRLFYPVFSAYKTDRHDITELLLKVALNTINQTKHIYIGYTARAPNLYAGIPKYCNEY